MLEGIKILLSLGLPDKWGVGSQKYKEAMCGSGVVRNESVKKIGFALENL